MESNRLTEEDIFATAVAITSPVERAEYLQRACGDQEALRQRVEALLRGHDASKGILDAPPPGLGATATSSHRISEGPGSQLGRYKLLQVLGEGGMGTVFMAEQREPIKRRVALKIIKAGMDTQQVINRFEAERQALALMDHPNIARVLDAGATEGGRPFFVMELVKGVPLTHYCDEHHLTPAERLELFLPICNAIQHAHQKGIIHRDLKPSNILVAEYDEHPVPKIIDFGVAKAICQTLTEKTVFTQYGQVVGTLEYMSPEQAKLNQLDIDTRSDIYSLGAILYELLTGETPFDKRRLQGAAFDEILRIIREEEPPRPSTKLSGSGSLPSIAASRRTEPNRLSGILRGELDWIVMKALEKDRGRRYDSAAAFALDIQHFLNDQPVLACPPSTGYRFRKFARRNKAALATATAIAVVLVAGIIGTTWEAIRATREANRALEAEAIVERRYQSEKAAHEDADRARAAEAIQRQLAEQKSQEAARSAAEADTQRAQTAAERDRAEANFAQARRAVNDYFVQVSTDPSLARPDLADLRKELLRSALGFYEEFLQDRNEDPTLKLELAQTVLKVAEIRSDLGENAEAATAFQEALARFQELLRTAPSDLEARIGEATCLRRLGQYTEALARWEQLRSERPDDERILLATGDTYNQAGVALSNDKPSESLAMYEKARELRVKLLEKDPASSLHLGHLAQTLNNIAMLLQNQPSRFADAATLLGEARKLGEQAHRLAPENFEIAGGAAAFASNEGLALVNLGRLAEGADAFRRAAEISRSLAAKHPTLQTVQKRMVFHHRMTAHVYARLGRVRDAALITRRLREAIENQPADTAGELYALAQSRALCATRIHEDGSGGSWLTEEELEEEARAAVEALRAAIERGFRNGAQLHDDAAFDSIRNRPDFHRLAKKVELLATLTALQNKPVADQEADLERFRETLEDFTYSMNADGTGNQVEAPLLVFEPLRAPLSARKYGSGRWQLMLGTTADAFEAYKDFNGNGQYDAETETLQTFPGVEVFAHRWTGNAWQVLQVTDTSRDGFRSLSGGDISLAWSNDGNDSFLSVRLTGYDVDADGRYMVSDSRPQIIARIHVSGADLDFGVDPLVRAADPKFEIVAADLTATINNYAEIFSSHSWSPDGAKLVISNSGTFSNPGANLFVWDVATGTSQFLLQAYNDGVDHRWSPDGSKIVVGDGGTIRLVNADGTGLKVVQRRSGLFHFPVAEHVRNGYCADAQRSA